MQLLDYYLKYGTSRIFYVCSWGGCGSMMLCNYLSRYGISCHIHSRYPPPKLTIVHKGTEYFSDKIVKNNNITVIFIYRNPIKSIFSRHLNNPAALKNIQTNPNTTLQDVIEHKKDLYGFKEFFDNYTKKNKNYDIYCVKYEDFFENISIFNKTFNLPDIKEKYPIEKITEKKYIYTKELNEVYKELIDEMNEMDFITKI